MAGLVIIRKAINTPILFNWYEFICHSLLSRLQSSSLSVAPGVIFMHALFVVCMFSTDLLPCLLSIQWRCSVWAWQQTDVSVGKWWLLQKKRHVCTTLPAWIKTVWLILSFFMLPSSLFLSLCRFSFLFGSLPLVDSFSSHPLFFICLTVVCLQSFLQIHFSSFLPLLLSPSVCFLIPPSWHSLFP